MIGQFFTWLATALSLLVVDIVVPGIDIRSFAAALIAAVVIGFVNTSIRPALRLLTLPLNFATLGLFSFVVNGASLWIASLVSPGFRVDGFIPAILGAVLLSIVNTFLSNYFAQKQAEQLVASDSQVNT
ncbi:phage holin family protein [Leptolyngbya sp. FACHB-261]|uniref:phage holin family protein n=1 Tax=Leptolyngbya sp. FACHB-261 TaxID=2692806 RepID=UPI0016843506|nr:phage holin family protein [Leptolyngbya sp. FACHB-261]MBD2103301.1 phage holin family protein [Leptolyngbya sp. FACHB-261]